MAFNENEVRLMGNLGADPDLRYTKSGTPVCNLRLCTNRSWIGADKNRHEEATWHRVTVFGRQALICKEYLHKGDLLKLRGRLTTRDWTDKDGNKRSTVEVTAERVDLPPKALSKTASAAKPAEKPAEETKPQAKASEPTPPPADEPPMEAYSGIDHQPEDVVPSDD